jgi:D-sedoheptulose 7-phosphate isomerase
MSIRPLLAQGITDLVALLPQLNALEPQLQALADAMQSAWSNKGKVLIAGNGGSAADAMHFAEELIARFQKNRRGLAAVALCDPTVITCAANDFGYDDVFSRQVEALGNPGDVLVVMTTSGNSSNILKALDAAKRQGLVTCTFLGKDGGKARGQADIELLVPARTSHRIQEGHKLLFHTVCEYVDTLYD